MRQAKAEISSVEQDGCSGTDLKLMSSPVEIRCGFLLRMRASMSSTTFHFTNFLINFGIKSTEMLWSAYRDWRESGAQPIAATGKPTGAFWCQSTVFTSRRWTATWWFSTSDFFSGRNTGSRRPRRGGKIQEGDESTFYWDGAFSPATSHFLPLFRLPWPATSCHCAALQWGGILINLSQKYRDTDLLNVRIF